MIDGGKKNGKKKKKQGMERKDMRIKREVERMVSEKKENEGQGVANKIRGSMV
jgi:hypothetical protein